MKKTDRIIREGRTNGMNGQGSPCIQSRNRSFSPRRANRRAAAAACLLAALLCAGCGGEGSMSSDIGSSNNIYSGGNVSNSAVNGSFESEGFSADSWEASGDGAVKNNVDVTVDTDRKMIRTVNLSAETREFEQAMNMLETQVRQLGGYIETMETYNGSRYSGSRSTRYSNMTVRIPKGKLDDFLETVSGVCNVTRRNEEVKDVTLSYVDIESRRDTLRTEQERLLSFLEKAESVQEIIALEERLSDVRYQLESMEARLRTIDNQVDFATVNLNLSEVQELTPVQEPTAWERLAEGFMGNLGDVGEGLVNFCIWFVINIPYFVIWGIIITVAVLIIRRSFRRNKEKALAQAAKADAEWKAARPNGTNAEYRPQMPNQAGGGPAKNNAGQRTDTGVFSTQNDNNMPR